MSRTTPCLRIHESIAPGGLHAVITNVLYGKEDESMEQKEPAWQLNPGQREKKAAPVGQQEANAALAALAATGNAFALGQLWEINRGLLRSMFWKWYPSHLEQADAHGLTADDFEQEGYFAVQYAAQTYDPGKGFAFSTWLQQAMKRQIHLVLIGEHRRKISDKNGNTRVISANPLNQSVSLDTPLDSDDPGGATLCDVQEDQAAACDIEAAEEAVFTEQLHAAIEEALQKLTEREADVIRRRYYGNQGQRQIAQVYGVSSTRVQQLEKTAFTKLRRNRRLIQWCDEVILSSAWRGIGFSAWQYGGSVQERTVEYIDEHMAAHI